MSAVVVVSVEPNNVEYVPYMVVRVEPILKVDAIFATRVLNDVPLMDVMVAVGTVMVEPTERVDATLVILSVNVDTTSVLNRI